MRSPDRSSIRSPVRRLVAAGGAAGAWLVAAGAALAASPTPSPQLGDPRSGGQGPGLVGDPLLAIGAVAVIGLLSLAGTLLYLRATGGRRGTDA
jgi:hypothetical protein